MYLLCGGRLSDSLSSELRKMTQLSIQGVEDIKDITVTLSNRGLEHFGGVKGILVLDTGIGITEGSELANLARLDIPVTLVTRYLESMNLRVEENSIKIKSVEQDIPLSLLAAIIRGM